MSPEHETGIAQTNELRAGHLNSVGTFVNPPGGSSLIQLRAIAAPIQERLDNAPLENIRTFRTSLNTIGDGFIEAIANQTFTSIRNAQPAAFQGTIINVPVVEAIGALRVGRFGWKNQHASLHSFSGDAYLNEMGITNPFDGNGGQSRITLWASRSPPRHRADPEDDGEDVAAFANFMRATRAPGRGAITAAVLRGETLFEQASCSVCHTPSIVTAPAGTLINGGAFTVPAVLGDERIHPFSDFLLHDIGTGDGIVQNGGAATRNMVRTPPLWGVRTRALMMHDGLTFTFTEAIQRHAGTGGTVSRKFFNGLTAAQKADLIAFLKRSEVRRQKDHVDLNQDQTGGSPQDRLTASGLTPIRYKFEGINNVKEILARACLLFVAVACVLSHGCGGGEAADATTAGAAAVGRGSAASAARDEPDP